MSIKWGIIGCGNVAEHKGGPALYRARGCELVAVMSRNETKAASFAKRHGAKRYYTRYEDLLADDEVNAVYVATPPHVHAEQVIASARAGKHVMCEKPMAMTLAECDEMIHTADQCSVQLMVAYYRRTFPAVLKIEELIDTGRIGRPTQIRTEVAGLFKPAADDELPWRVDPTVSGGGFMWDVGSHRIDLMIHLMGRINHVAAFVDTVTFDIPVEDAATLMLRFANGAHGSGIYHWNVNRGSDEIEVGGTGGRILCEMGSGRVKLTRDDGEEEWILPPPEITHLSIVEDLVAAIEQGRENCISGREGRKTNAVLEAAVRSSRDGRVVEVI